MSFKRMFFYLLLLFTFSSGWAQENNYSINYLEKVKCKKCELKIYNYKDTISQIRTFKTKKIGGDPYIIWHGYNVTYYDNGKPKRVMNYFKEIKDGDYIEFYPNGNVKTKGSLKKTLKHGIWIEYDSTGHKMQSIQYKNGNDVMADSKNYYYFTYGLPKFREDSYDQCEDSIEQKWKIKYHPIAGCCVNDYIIKLAKKNNRKTDTKLSRLHGSNWEAKMEEEIKELCSKK